MYPLAHNFLIISTIFLITLNLIIPFVSNKESKTRNFLLIIISCFFFVNVLIIDWFFLKGIRINLSVNLFSNFSLAFHLEALGLIFLTLLSFLWIWSIIYTSKYLTINKIDNSSRFLFFINLSVLCGVMVALSANLFTMFTFYELLSLSTAPLIAHSGGSKVMSGVYKYLKILMISGGLLFLPSILIIYVKAGHGNFILDGYIKDYFSVNQAIILLLVFVFGISKAALFPMHQWLPAAMVAHYPVSALLHAVVVVKTGLFCIYKILIYIFGLKYLQSIFENFNWFIFIPIITIFYSSIKALQTNNIKNILAYSTINQLAISLLSAFMFTSKSLGAAILHLCSHSFTKICLFYGMGNIYSAKKAIRVTDLTNSAREMPIASFIVLMASLSLIGIPPFGGFISKFSIMLAAAGQNQLMVMVTLAFSTVLSALYLIKLIAPIYNSFEKKNLYSGTDVTQTLLQDASPSLPLGEGVGETANNKASSLNKYEKNTPIFMLLSLVVCSIAVILFYFIEIFIKKFFIYI